jgi:16S rRNA (guanine527-N7)-methyltransferase
VAERWPEAAAGLAAYAALLADAGVTRGLVGPREVPRLWDRHLLNCAVVESELPDASHVADIGAGAGLPGLVLAIVRPDLAVTLVEPLARRADFLREAVAALDLEARVTVRHERAEEAAGAGFTADVVTARAVAPLERLAGWCCPLVRVGGLLVAMKGSRAAEEVVAAESVLAAWGMGSVDVRLLGQDLLDTPTTVVVGVRTSGRSPRSTGKAAGPRRSAKRRTP